MSRSIEFVALGDPKPQGSKKAYVNRATGRAQIVEDNKGTRPWRDTVTWAARDAAHATLGGKWDEPWSPLEGAVGVNLRFTLARPKFHYTPRGMLRPAAPARPAKKPDVDKMVRAVFDSLTAAGIYRDDAQVVDVRASKWFAGDLSFTVSHALHGRATVNALEVPGVFVQVWSVDL